MFHFLLLHFGLTLNTISLVEPFKNVNALTKQKTFVSLYVSADWMFIVLAILSYIITNLN